MSNNKEKEIFLPYFDKNKIHLGTQTHSLFYCALPFTFINDKL